MESATLRNRLVQNAREEAKKNNQSLIHHGNTHNPFVTTVFLLDTSASMLGEGLEQMKKSFKDIINEFSKHPSITENVSVITFGEEVKILHYYSTDYRSITRCVDDLECSGGSPLEAGIIMCLSGMFSAPFCAFGALHVRTRIVIITDGKPTEYDTRKDLEIYESASYNATTDSVIDIARQIGRNNPIFCIPVGSNPDICFLATVAMESDGGKIVLQDKAQQFGRYAINIMLASETIRKVPEECRFSREAMKLEVSRLKSVSDEDLDDVCEIIENKNAYRSITELIEENERNHEKEYEERDAAMPCVGTRVRRGPDWKWKNQDGHGAGTVVGHSQRDGWINVEWDTGLELPYRYRDNGVFTEYDIEKCDVPRILENQPIAVGCLVRRGRDWKWGDQDGGEGNIGTVYRLKTLTEIYVRWPNGNKSNYRYGYEQKFDVELCDPFDPDVVDALKKQTEGKTVELTSCEEKPSAHGNRRKDVDKTYFRNDSNSHGCNSNSGESALERPGNKPKIKTIMNKQRTGMSDHSLDVGTYREWQWRGPNGVWNEFTKEANETIDLYDSKPTNTTFIIDLNGHLCRIHLKKKKMVNTITKAATDIRLKEDDTL